MDSGEDETSRGAESMNRSADQGEPPAMSDAETGLSTDVGVVPKLGQICTKWDKSGTF